MAELSAADRRRIVRGELWRRSRTGLGVVAAIGAAGAILYGLGIPFASSPELYGHRPMDESLHNWLLLIAGALILVSGLSGFGGRSLLRRLPIDPADELRSRLEIGLVCGVFLFSGFLLAELLARPVMMNPSFGSRLNPAEAATLERLGGVPLLRFTVDGEERRILATDATLAGLPETGLWGYGDRNRVGWQHSLVVPLPVPGTVITRVTSEDWPRFGDRRRDVLVDLGLPAEAAVAVVYEGLVPAADYLAGSWRRDGLFRDRDWPLLDRAAGFFGLLIVGICVISPLSVSQGGWLFVAPLALSFVREASGLLFFSELGPDFTLRVPQYQAQILWRQKLVWPALIAALSLAFVLASRRRIRRCYTGRADGALLGPIMKSFVVVYILGSWLGGGPAAALRGLQEGRLDLLSYLTRSVAPLGWISALTGAVVLVLHRAETWSRRNRLLCRLPVQPREIVSKRLQGVLLGLMFVSVLPLVVEKLSAFAWSATGHLGAILPEIGWMGSLLILVAGVWILFLSQSSGWKARASVSVALIGTATAVWLLTRGRLPPWSLLALTALSTAALPALQRVMEGRMARGAR